MQTSLRYRLSYILTYGVICILTGNYYNNRNISGFIILNNIIFYLKVIIKSH